MHGQHIGYVCVSSFDQNPERQLEHIEIGKVFTDKAAGKDGQQPEWKSLRDRNTRAAELNKRR